MDSDINSENGNRVQNIEHNLSSIIKSNEDPESEIENVLTEIWNENNERDPLIKKLAEVAEQNPLLRLVIINVLPDVLNKWVSNSSSRSNQIETSLIATLAYYEWDLTVELLEDPSNCGKEYTETTLSKLFIESSNDNYRECLITAAIHTIKDAATAKTWSKSDVEHRIDTILKRIHDRKEFLRRLTEIAEIPKVREYLRDGVLEYLLQRDTNQYSQQFHLLVKEIAYHHWKPTLRIIESIPRYNPRVGLIKAVIQIISDRDDWLNTEIENRIHDIWKYEHDKNTFLKKLSKAIDNDGAIGAYLLREFPDHLFVWIKDGRSVEAQELLSVIARTRQRSVRQWLLNSQSPISWHTGNLNYDCKRLEALSMQTIERVIEVRPDIVTYHRPNLITNSTATIDSISDYVISNIDTKVSSFECEAALSSFSIILDCLPRKKEDAQTLEDDITAICKNNGPERQQAVQTLAKLIETYPKSVSIFTREFLLNELSESSLPAEREAATRALSALNEIGSPDNLEEIQKHLVKLLGASEQTNYGQNKIKMSLSTNCADSVIEDLISDVRNNEDNATELMRGLIRSLEISDIYEVDQLEKFISEQLTSSTNRAFRRVTIETLLELFVENNKLSPELSIIEKQLSSVSRNEILCDDQWTLVPLQEPERLAWCLIADEDTAVDVPPNKIRDTVDCVIARGYEEKIPAAVGTLLEQDDLKVVQQLLNILNDSPHLFVGDNTAGEIYEELLKERFEVGSGSDNIRSWPLSADIVAGLIEASPSIQSDIFESIEEDVSLPDRDNDPNDEIYNKCREEEIHSGIRKIVYYDYIYAGSSTELINSLQRLEETLTRQAARACSKLQEEIQLSIKNEPESKSCKEALNDLIGVKDVNPEKVSSKVKEQQDIDLSCLYELSEVYIFKNQVYVPQDSLTEIDYMGEKIKRNIAEEPDIADTPKLSGINAIEFKEIVHRLTNNIDHLGIKRYGNIVTGPLQIFVEAILWCDLNSNIENNKSSSEQRIDWSEIYIKISTVDEEAFKRAVDWTVARAIQVGVDQEQIKLLIEKISGISTIGNSLEHVINGVWTFSDSIPESPLSPTWKIAINEDIAELRSEYDLVTDTSNDEILSQDKRFDIIAYAAQYNSDSETNKIIDHTTQQKRWECILDYLLNDLKTTDVARAVSEVIQATTDDEYQNKLANALNSLL